MSLLKPNSIIQLHHSIVSTVGYQEADCYQDAKLLQTHNALSGVCRSQYNSTKYHRNVHICNRISTSVVTILEEKTFGI